MTEQEAAEDFYEAGKTYIRSSGWMFRVDVITTHPEDGDMTALGWRLWDGKWEEYAYGTSDWEIYNVSKGLLGE